MSYVVSPPGIEKLRREVENLTSMSQDEQALDHPVTGEMIALLLVLSLFTIVGSVGNGLVLFVFSRVRDKTTAQLFMLALALIDLFTCMVIIPFTMFVEYTRYDIKYDFLCKLYQFLITCKVPLSAFIMVAIGFDRYFCICHPLRKIITPWRTKAADPNVYHPSSSSGWTHALCDPT
ncbi:cholecystokinin receptor type A-like [Littorina saxatilis]|uniref:cholecystokinin receptor type A-like n=1 Tax=Littorina saxatilis TaxID=31220 RepID=UPI0038B6A992